MTWGIYNQQTRDLVLLLSSLSWKSAGYEIRFERAHLVEHGSLRSDSFLWEICGTDLLCDTTCFAFLDVRLPNLLQASN